MWGWFGGGAAAKKNAPKNAIINLREQLDMLTKRERHLEQQIADQDAAARKNISTNKNRRPLHLLLLRGNLVFFWLLRYSTAKKHSTYMLFSCPGCPQTEEA